MAILLSLVPSRIRHATACFILVFPHYRTCPWDRTYRLFPSDSIFYQLVLCGCTRSTYWAWLHPSYSTRLCKYEGANLQAKRLTHYSDCLSSSVCNLMGRCPIHLVSPAVGARRFPPIYPAKGIQSHGWPQRVQCFKMCSLRVVIAVGTPLTRRPVMTGSPNAWAGGGCYLVFSKFVPVKVGSLCPVLDNFLSNQNGEKRSYAL